MINKFDPTIPNTESRILSEPVRNNFNALNDRTNQLTPSATSPVSTSVRIGVGDKLYFEDNVYVPFPGGLIDLGSSINGVSAFNTPGTFKEIIVYYYNSGGSGTLGFLESIEKFTKVRDTQTLINSTSDQRDPLTGVPSQNLLKGRIPVCSILVTNNGTAGQRGQIVQVGDPDILDIRPFMQRGGGAEDLAAHVNAPTLSAAHPSALIDNNSLIVTGRTSSVPLVAAPGVTAGTKQIFVNGNTALFTGREGEFIRIPTTAVSINGISGQTQFITAKIVTVNIPSNYLIVDRPLPAIPAGRLIINGQITLDKMGFDIASALSEVTNSTFLRIETNMASESVYKLGLNAVIDENVDAAAAIAGTKISPDFGSQTITTTGVVDLNNTTQSSSTSTGALITDGGLGVAKNVNIGQVLTVTGTSNLSSLSTSSWITADGYVSTDSYLTSTSTENATSLVTGALRILSGGASIGLNLRVGGLIYAGTTPTQLTDAAGKVLSASLNTVAIAQGGTGQVTQAAGFDALAPTTTSGDIIYRNASTNVRLGIGSSNQVLFVTGGAPSWGLITNSNIDAAAAIARSKIATGSLNHVIINDGTGALSSEAQLSVTRGGTGAATFTAGYLLVGNGTSAVTTLQHTASNVVSTVVSRDGSGNFSAGTITATFSGNLTGNVTGNVSGTALNVTGIVAIANGGTGQATAAAGFDALAPTTTTGDLIYRGPSGNIRLAVGTANRVLTSDGTNPSWTLLTDSNIASGAGIAFNKLANLSSGNILVGSAGAVPTSVAVTGDVVISNTGVTSISAGVIVDADINGSAAIARSKIANDVTNPNGVVINSGAALSSLAQLNVGRGGTGAAIFSAGQLLTGNGTSAVTTTQHTPSNVASTVVSRDASGDFSAGTITANIVGNITGNLDGGYINGQLQTSNLISFTANSSAAIVIATNVSGATVTMPSAPEDGRIIMIKNAAGNPGALAPNLGQSIYASDSTVIGAQGAAMLVYQLSTTTWYRIV